MKTNQLLCLLLFSLLSLADAINLQKRQHGLEPRVMAVNIQRREVADPIAHDRRRLSRRDDTVNVGIDNEVS
jgi:hypothetical protein